MVASSSAFPARPPVRRLLRLLGRPGFHLFLTGALMVLGFGLAHRLSERSGREQLSALSTERLELYASNLAAELGRHASLPSLLAIAPTLQALMQAPDDADARRAASQMPARTRSSSPARAASCCRPASR